MNNIIYPMTRYNPQDTVDLSNMVIGGHVVSRRRLAGTSRILYRVMRNGRVAGQQLSIPTPADCAAFVRIADEKDAGHIRVPTLLDQARRTLAQRLLDTLQKEAAPMTLPQLVGSLQSSTDALSPVLNRLVKGRQVSRTGEPGAHIYAAR